MIIAKIEDKLIDAYLSLKSRIDICPFGEELQGYWIRRKEIFSQWDHGIRTDAVGLFSATPEKIANQIAQSIKAGTVVDAFCGIGATAIAFAKVCDKVIAIDLDQNRINIARHNAEIYGVENKIEFINKDIFAALPQIKAEAIFLDPPWGGVNYLDIKDFKLSDFQPDGNRLLEESFKYYQRVALRVPRQFDLSELDRYHRAYQVQDNYIRSKLYSKTVYFEG